MVAKKIAEILLDKEAVKLNFDPPFTYTSGMKGPIYCDNRVLISYVEERKFITDTFCSIIEEKGLNPDYIAGTATAAIPWAAFVADKLNLPMVYIRPQKKEHGAAKQIEGYLPAGKKVVVVEDLITTGGSSISSVNAIRNEGQCDCTDVLAIFTYGFDRAKNGFAEINATTHAMSDFGTLLEVALESGKINQEAYEKIQEYRKDPLSWAEKMGL
ncbi:orotate phosphoribosyltransferase [Patescibacteria group bacterium]|nr:orotate phosphoribosyltransferase [Patescibacteria group bacterium]